MTLEDKLKETELDIQGMGDGVTPSRLLLALRECREQRNVATMNCIIAESSDDASHDEIDAELRERNRDNDAELLVILQGEGE